MKNISKKGHRDEEGLHKNDKPSLDGQ